MTLTATKMNLTVLLQAADSRLILSSVEMFSLIMRVTSEFYSLTPEIRGRIS